MNTWLLISLLLALGIIVGNIMLLKYSAKMKFEKPKTIETPVATNNHNSNEQNDSEKLAGTNMDDSNDMNR